MRFGIVGFASNLVLYSAYLGFTGLGLGHKSAMSLLYVVGVLQTYNFNKKWTFRYHGNFSVTLIRYICLYALGYLINLAVLIVAVDWFGFQHQWVQGTTILVVAVFLFFGQKLWVFGPADAS